MRRPSSPSVPRTFRMDGSNLPLVVREFCKHHEGDFKDWLEHRRTVLPDLGMIDVIERPEECHLYGQVLLATHSLLIVGLTKREKLNLLDRKSF